MEKNQELEEFVSDLDGSGVGNDAIKLAIEHIRKEMNVTDKAEKIEDALRLFCDWHIGTATVVNPKGRIKREWKTI